MSITFNEAGEAVVIHDAPRKKPGRPRHSRAHERSLRQVPVVENVKEPAKHFGSLEEVLWPEQDEPQDFQTFISKCTFVRANGIHINEMAKQLEVVLSETRRHEHVKPIEVKDLPWGLRAKLSFIANAFGMDSSIFRVESGVVEPKDFRALANIKMQLLHEAEAKHPNSRPFSGRSQPGVGDYTLEVRKDPRKVDVRTK